MAHVNVSDLELRWKPLSEDEKVRASVLIEDAEALISALGANLDEVSLSVLIPIVCSVVKRAMPDQGDGSAIESLQKSAGPFSETFKFANPSGDMYLTKLEKRQLGISQQRIGMIAPRIGGDPND